MSLYRKAKAKAKAKLDVYPVLTPILTWFLSTKRWAVYKGAKKAEGGEVSKKFDARKAT